METKEILDQLTPIFKEILDNDSINLSESTTAKDIEEWDSITHIQLMVAIEKHFKTRFTAQEIRQFKNVGEICETIKLKTV